MRMGEEAGFSTAVAEGKLALALHAARDVGLRLFAGKACGSGQGAADKFAVVQEHHSGVVGAEAVPRGAPAHGARPVLIVGLRAVFALKLVGEDGEVFRCGCGAIVGGETHGSGHHFGRQRHDALCVGSEVERLPLPLAVHHLLAVEVLAVAHGKRLGLVRRLNRHNAHPERLSTLGLQGEGTAFGIEIGVARVELQRHARIGCGV